MQQENNDNPVRVSIFTRGKDHGTWEEYKDRYLRLLNEKGKDPFVWDFWDEKGKGKGKGKENEKGKGKGKNKGDSDSEGEKGKRRKEGGKSSKGY